MSSFVCIEKTVQLTITYVSTIHWDDILKDIWRSKWSLLHSCTWVKSFLKHFMLQYSTLHSAHFTSSALSARHLKFQQNLFFKCRYDVNGSEYHLERVFCYFLQAVHHASGHYDHINPNDRTNAMILENNIHHKSKRCICLDSSIWPL